MWKKLIVGALLLAVNPGPFASAGEIGFLEDFALARDRQQALQQLVPGSEDHYYFRSLYLHQMQQFDEIEPLVQEWITRHGRTPRVIEIQLRHALLTYDRDPAKSLETIRQHLQLQFDHQRQQIGEKPDLPTALDPQLLARERLLKQVLEQSQSLDGLEDSAFEWLIGMPLDAERRRLMLQRLSRPAHAELPKLIAEDLKHPNSGGFGSLAIHRQLLLSELDALLELTPELLNQQKFVEIYLSKLVPAPDVDWRRDRASRDAYLTRLWSFVSRLAPAHNSLKVHVLYHWLAHDRQQGKWDRNKFLLYLRLPRPAPYIAKQFSEQESFRRFPADLTADFSGLTGLPPVGNDEPLVRAYLHHFFLEEASTAAFEAFVHTDYLREVFAETKILNGLGDPAQWYSLLSPERYQALKNRVDLDFSPSNPEHFRADDAVKLDVYVKNVPTLIVKVFEINSRNFHRQHQQPVNTDINLDGLVANDEKTYTYEEPPLRRVRRTFAFPELNQPGIYVVDFIGNGMSSRVVVRKGEFRHIVRTSSAGHVFTVFDEQNQPVKDAVLWLGGHEYQADAEGELVVPFTDKPGRSTIVISRKTGYLSTLASFDHLSESYELTAGIHVDREALLSRKPAEVLIRPALTVHGHRVSPKILEDVRFTIRSEDLDGIVTTKEVSSFTLADDRESTFEFTTPPRLASVTFTLSAKVQVLSTNKKVDLSASQTFTLNSIDKSEHIEDLHLAAVQEGYFLEVLGKSGEPRPDRPVHLQIKHRDFREPISVTLKSDAQGRVDLGKLPDIDSVTARVHEQLSHTWRLLHDQSTIRAARHSSEDRPLSIPFFEPLDRSTVSLLELRGETFVADRFEHLSVEDGYLWIKGLPPGDFDLWLKRPNQHVRVRITDGRIAHDYVLGDYRYLEHRPAPALQIVKTELTPEKLVIQLDHSKTARVHVLATRYVPEYSAFQNLSNLKDAGLQAYFNPVLGTWYVSGRNIGDEYRYILDRKLAKKFPGVMIERPGTLLNPWAVRSTDTQTLTPRDGEAFDPAAPPSALPRLQLAEEEMAKAASRLALLQSNLDFLLQPSVVLSNLVPDENGIIEIARSELGAHHLVQVIAVDPHTTVARYVRLPAAPLESRDLRLAKGLDAQGHYTQQKQVTVVTRGQGFQLADIVTAKFETYGELAKVYRLYMTLTQDAKLAEFGFITTWMKQSPEEKRRLYSKYACHELNVFLFKKDPKFFEAVIQPYVANKMDKTFVDHWLLGNPLESYLEPWSYAQLNVPERILLFQRVAADRENGRRHIQHLFELQPTAAERENLLFATAIRGTILDFAGGATEVQLEERVRQLGAVQLESEARFAAPAPDSAAATNGRRDMAEKEQMQAEDKVSELAAGAKRLAKRSAGSAWMGDTAAYFMDDLHRRRSVQQFYQQVDQTQEWAENNYYQLPIEVQNASLIAVNAFWRDFAMHEHAGDKPFLSTNFPDASRNFAEMMLAMAMLDLSFEAESPESQIKESELKLTANSPLIIFHEEILPVKENASETPILVSQNFFQMNDRYRHENQERLDKFVTDEFLVHTVYGCQIVVTNPTSSPQRLDVLTQIPVGSIAVNGGEATRGTQLQLDPFSTRTVEYFFYFPVAGKYPHYPVHVSREEKLVAHAQPVTLNVVDELSRIDRTSWEYVSQNGNAEEVLAFLRTANLQRISLSKIAFRMKDKPFFLNVVRELSQRHAYDHVLWSYGLLHQAVPAIEQFLRHSPEFVQQVGESLESPLMKIDPVDRHLYQHLEYSPLVNARTHQLGTRRQIVNDRFLIQYHQLLKILGYQRELTDEERLAVTYYLLLQDRFEESAAFFERIEPEHLATRLQYDYFAAYFALLNENPAQAEEIATQYASYPVDRWRQLFQTVIKQVEEARGGPSAVVNSESRGEAQDQLAAKQPSLDFQVESQKVTMNYRNLPAVTVNYYLMDIELLFSRNPFVQTQASQFANIRPNQSVRVELPADQNVIVFDLPAALRQSNVLIEIVGAGEVKSRPYYSNSLNLQVQESYGQVQTTSHGDARPLSKVYVKTYARMKDGSVKFYKDGYTDLRGRFEYASLNTNELDHVDRFALLILSEEHGATVREVAPPRR